MRHIKKTSCAAIAKWKGAEKNSPQNLNFDNMPKGQIIKCLIAEQGALCGYTMRRITEATCHIEHIIPQNQDEEKSIDYNNMIACYPKDGGEKIGYGAPQKGGTKINLSQNFISPLSAECGLHFEYTKSGNILPKNKGDIAAQSTIEILNLNADILKDSRLRALAAHGLISLRQARKSPFTKNDPLSIKAAERLAVTACDSKFWKELPEFCAMLRQIAGEYAKREAQKSKRLHKNNR